MKRLSGILVFIFVMSSLCAAGEKPPLTNETASESYSMGYRLGADFRNQGSEMDLEALIRGMQDGMQGEKPLLNKKEMNAAITNLRKRMVLAKQEAFKKQAADNLEKGKAFLEENGKKEGVVTLPSGLQYRVLKEGTGKSPGPDDTVTVQYRGTLIDGTEFDSSYTRKKPETTKVSGVIPGWTEALQLMKEGSKWQLFVPSDLAYGDRPRGRRIPPNSTLIFEVELVSVGKRDKTPAKATSEARKMKIKGQIVNGTQGYVIRGKVPKEVFPILNANPAVLNELVKSGQIVNIDARIVLGDNVDIEKINGEDYPGKRNTSEKTGTR